MSEQDTYEVSDRFDPIKKVLLENAYYLNTPQSCQYLPLAFLNNTSFMLEFAKKVQGLVHPSVTDQSSVAEAVFESIGKEIPGFKGKTAKTVQTQIKDYFEGKASKTFLKTVIAAEDKNFKQNPLSFASNVDNKAMLDIIFDDESLNKSLNGTSLALALSLKDLSPELQEQFRLEAISSGALKKFIDNVTTSEASCTRVFEEIIDRWNIAALSAKVAEALLNAVQVWPKAAQLLPVLAQKISPDHYTKKFTSNFVKIGIDKVGLAILKSIPTATVAPIVQELFDSTVELDKAIEAKIKADPILTLSLVLDEEEGCAAIDNAYDLLVKVQKEFKDKLTGRLIEEIRSEFSGYNYTTVPEEIARIVTEETDHVEVFELMLKQNAPYVLQEMCKTHQDSITRNLVRYAMGSIIDAWYEEDYQNGSDKYVVEGLVNSLVTAEDFSKIDNYVLSSCDSFDNFSRSLTVLEKRWAKKSAEVVSEYKALTSWQKIQVLSRFFVLDVCDANYDPKTLVEEGANVKGNRQVRNYLPNSLNWALFEIKENAKDLAWTALTTKKAIKLENKDVKFYSLASKYFQASECKKYNPYSGFDVGAYEELCKAEKCAPYGDSAKSKALMYLTYLLGKNTATAQALIKKAADLGLDWSKVPTDLTAEEKAAMLRLMSESGEMWQTLHLFKSVIEKSGLDVTYKEFDKASVMHYYVGVTEENYPMAYQLKKWKFDDHVFQEYMDLKPKKKSNIPLHEQKYDNKYLAHVLKPGDARALVMGEESGCCQSLDNAASECAEAAYSQENSGIFAIDGEDGKLISQSFIWLSRDGKHLIVDSIETIHQLTATSPYTKLITPAYLDLAAEMSKKKIQVVMSASNYNNAGSRVYNALEKMFPKELAIKSYNHYYDDENEYVYSEHFDAEDNFDYSDLSDKVVNLSKLVKSKEKSKK